MERDYKTAIKRWFKLIFPRNTRDDIKKISKKYRENCKRIPRIVDKKE